MKVHKKVKRLFSYFSIFGRKNGKQMILESLKRLDLEI